MLSNTVCYCKSQLRVYSSLPCQDLQPIKPLEPPPSIVEITARKALMSSTPRGGKGRVKRKFSRLKSPPEYYLSHRRSALNASVSDREYDKTPNKFLTRLSPLSESRDVRRMTISEESR